MTLSAIVNGTTYSLSDGTYCYWLDHDGFGMAPMHRLSDRGPLQHGDTDRGYRLDPRIVRLVLDINGFSHANMETLRMSLLSIFKPSNTPLILQNVRDDGTYCLDCFYLGDTSMPSSDKQGFNQKVVVTLKADDPTWYDPSGEDFNFSLGGGGDAMYVPTVIPMTVGASTINATQAINYSGSVASYPFIRITGPITNCVITNNSTGEKLDFTGFTIESAHYYDIDLRYGYKTVISNHGTNKIAELTDDSNLESFHLEAAPDVGGGINSINVSGSGVTESTSVSISWFNRYIGI